MLRWIQEWKSQGQKHKKLKDWQELVLLLKFTHVLLAHLTKVNKKKLLKILDTGFTSSKIIFTKISVHLHQH